MQTEPDAELIDEVKKGNLVAFNKVVELHKNPVFHFCLKMLSNREEAEEVAQDVFVIVYKKIKSFEGKSKFTTWLYRITYNECISRIRRNKKTEKLHDIDEHAYQLPVMEKAYHSMDHDFRAKVLNRSMDELDEESRTIILLFYYHEKSVNEISEVLRLSVTNVKTKLFRARKCMLSFMEKKLRLSKNEMLER